MSEIHANVHTCIYTQNFIKIKVRSFRASIDCWAPFTNHVKSRLQVEEQVIKDQCTNATMMEKQQESY